MTENLFYLGLVFDDKEWLAKADLNLKNMQEVIQQYPTSFGYWSSVFLKQSLGIQELALTGKEIESALSDVLQIYLPNKILQSSDHFVDLPLLRDKIFEEKISIYRCRQYACALPVTTVTELKKDLFKEYLNKYVHNN